MSENIENSKYVQGCRLKPSDSHFTEGMQAVVDYRGDVSVHLKDGSKLTGYVFHADHKGLDMLPRDSSRRESVPTTEILEIEFSGEDTAKGKSWEDWMKKKATEKGSQATLDL